MEFSTIKKWPVGSPIQSVLDCVEALFRGKAVCIDKIASVAIQVPANRFHIIDDRDMPAVCSQHPVALALSDGKVGFKTSHSQDRMKSPEILAWRKKIALLPDEDLSRASPERQSIITVEMADGTMRKHHAKVVRGTPDDPMQPEEVAAKAADILSGVLPDGGRALIDTCFEEKFAMQDLVEASVLPKVGTERPSVAAQA